MTQIANGQCLCGAVKMQGLGTPSLGICHCDMCQKWHGGPSYSASFEDGINIIEGEDKLAWFTSSDWAERGFCKTCGSTLFYRTLDGAMLMGESGSFELPKGLKMAQHFFIDEKPDYYDVSDDAPKYTAAEVFAMYAPKETED